MSNEWKMVPVEPTEEMVYAIATRAHCGDSGKDIWSEALAYAPVPPAGDVEVLGYKHVTRTGYEVVTEKDHPPVIPGAVWIKAIALTDRAHAVGAQADAAEADELRKHFQEESEKFEAEVTRLTAERDGLLAEAARRGRCYTTEKNLRQEYQAELAKARELNKQARKVIEQFMPNVGKCFGIDFMLLNETLMALATHNVDESCGQDAEAAKGGA